MKQISRRILSGQKIPGKSTISLHSLSNAELVIAHTLQQIAQVIKGFSFFALAVMMFLTALDVIMRLFFRFPVPGCTELTEFMMVFTIFPLLAYTGLEKAHVTVDLVSSRLPAKPDLVVSNITALFSSCLVWLIVWSCAKHGINMLRTGTITGTLEVPVFPFYFMAVIGYGLYGVFLSAGLVSNLCKAISYPWSFWERVVWGSVVLFLALFSLFLLPKLSVEVLTPGTIGLIAIPVLVISLFSGAPIGLVMCILGFLGISCISGFRAGIYALGSVPYRTVADYFLSVIPLFVLMGAFAFSSGVSRDLYSAARKWFGQMPGGLALATIGACAFFAAVSGSSLASAATMGTIALPEMKKYNYDPKLASGCVAAGGTLGPMIPPSVVFVVYGILTEQSIGKLLIAGIFPGIILTILFMLLTYILVRRNPQLGPSGPRTTLREKLLAVRNIVPVLVMFCVVIGGIYVGFFSGTEAAALGAFSTFVYLVIRARRSALPALYSSLSEAGKTSSMIFLILTGAMILGYFLALSKLPWLLAEFISGLRVSRYVVVAGIMFVYLILGCLMDSMAMILLTIPIFFPVITRLGFDPIWFGVLIVVAVEMGCITPPVGMNVYIIAGLDKSIPMFDVFRGALPYLLCMIALVILLVLFPQIALFLPNLME